MNDIEIAQAKLQEAKLVQKEAVRLAKLELKQDEKEAIRLEKLSKKAEILEEKSFIQRKAQKFVEENNKEIYKNELFIFDRYFVCTIGNQIRIIDKCNPIESQKSFKDAQLYFAPEVAEVFKDDSYGIHPNAEGKLSYSPVREKKELFPIWFSQRETTRFDGLVMEPELEKVIKQGQQTLYNTWAGWAIKPDEKGICEKFIDFVLNDLCCGKMDRFNWMMDWIADMFQNPAKKHAKILVLQSEQGAGKTTLTETLEKLMGINYAVSLTKDNLINNFNSALYGKILCIADEIMWAGDRPNWNAMKNLSGNTSITITLKGKESFQAKNRIRILMTTNNKYAAPIEQGNRRYVVFPTSDEHIGNKKYFNDIYDELHNGGYEALMYYLMNREITTDFRENFTMFDNEATRECRTEALSSENPVAKWVLDSIENNTLDNTNIFQIKFNPEFETETAYKYNGEWIQSTVLYTRYKRWKEFSGEKKELSINAFASLLGDVFPKERKTLGMFYQINKDEAKKTLKNILGFELEEVKI